MAHILFYFPYNRCRHLRDDYKLTSNGISKRVYTSFPSPKLWILACSKFKTKYIKGLELCYNLRKDQSRKCSKNCDCVPQSTMAHSHILSVWYQASSELRDRPRV